MYFKEIFYVLVFFVFFNGVFDVEDILELDIEIFKKKYEFVLELSELERRLVFCIIVDIFNNLKGFLVKKFGDMYYFNYDFVMEVIIYVFGKYYF